MLKRVTIRDFEMPSGCLNCIFAKYRWDGWYDCVLTGYNFPKKDSFNNMRMNKCLLEEVEIN